MSPQAKAPKTPQRLLELLGDTGPDGTKIRERLEKNPARVLAEYGVSVAKSELPPNLRLPSRRRVKLALGLLKQARAAQTEKAWDVYAQLIVVIGAIPFVADDVRNAR
jgi:hypothetical protein